MTIFILITRAFCYPRICFLYLISGLSPKKFKGNNNNFDGLNSYISYNKFFALKQTSKGLIHLKDFLLANTSIDFHFQQCKHMGYSEKTCLGNLHSYK